MRTIFLRAVLTLALLGPGCPPALASAPAAADLDQDWAAFLGEFPPLGSAASGVDVGILLWLQDTRTRADLTRAGDEVSVRPGLFTAATGVDLTQGGYPHTQALLEAANRDLHDLVHALKHRFGRLRPFVADPRIRPGVPAPHGFSYPSGHAAWGALEAALLARLLPTQGVAILERGHQVGNDRALGGVHYPTDVEAGQRLGTAWTEAWLRDPDRRRQLEEAKAAEWP
jgi:membrane-associated phospholipid phosphatase